MSVAFRRESDEEHLEPKFELPIPPGPNLVTPRGLELTRAKVAEVEAAVAAAPTRRIAPGSSASCAIGTPRRHGRACPRSRRGRSGDRQHGDDPAERPDQDADIVGHDEADPAHDRIAYAARWRAR